MTWRKIKTRRRIHKGSTFHSVPDKIFSTEHDNTIMTFQQSLVKRITGVNKLFSSRKEQNYKEIPMGMKVR